MFKKGQKVRVKEGTTWAATSGSAGKIATVKAVQIQIDTASVFVQVLFDDPADQGWIHWYSDVWVNDYEIEAVEQAETPTP